MTRGNETTMAVLGMTSIVASICHHIGSMFHIVLTENNNGNAGGAENDEEKSVGSVSAVLFFVLPGAHEPFSCSCNQLSSSLTCIVNMSIPNMRSCCSNGCLMEAISSWYMAL